MKHHLVVAFTALAAAGAPSLALAEIQPETLTVQPRISEGGHVYVMDFGINDSSRIVVLDADDLGLQGTIGAGTFAQMRMNADRKTLFTSSAYFSRYSYGDVEAVVHEWDPATLARKREFTISNKMVQGLSQRGVLNVSADGNFLVVQNATPATSVTIASLAEGKDIAEIPTPGCWTAYPSAKGTAFTAICGDGTLAKYGYAADGSFSQGAKSDKIFDADTDPLFGDALRVGDNLVYVSYGGTLHVVDDSGDRPVLVRKVDFAEDGWAVSGYNLMAYHEPSGTLFVLMHDQPFDGSHKVPAKEIWAIDMKTDKVVGRSSAQGVSNITVSADADPVLFGLDHMGGVHRFDVTLGDKVTLEQTAATEGVAAFPTMLVTDF